MFLKTFKKKLLHGSPWPSKVMAFALATGAVGAQSAGVPAALRSRVDAAATEITPTLISTRRDLHQHPELGFRETRTAGIVADRLRALKFDEVRTGIGITGVMGIL